jgi:hypothetical protein
MTWPDGPVDPANPPAPATNGVNQMVVSVIDYLNGSGKTMLNQQTFTTQDGQPPSTLNQINLYDLAKDTQSASQQIPFPCWPKFWTNCPKEQKEGLDTTVNNANGLGNYTIINDAQYIENRFEYCAATDTYRLCFSMVTIIPSISANTTFRAWVWGVPDVNMNITLGATSSFIRLQLEIPIQVPRDLFGNKYFMFCLPQFQFLSFRMSVNLGPLGFPNWYPPFNSFGSAALNAVWPKGSDKISKLVEQKLSPVFQNLLISALTNPTNNIPQSLILDPNTITNACPSAIANFATVFADNVVYNSLDSTTWIASHTYTPSACKNTPISSEDISLIDFAIDTPNSIVIDQSSSCSAQSRFPDTSTGFPWWIFLILGVMLVVFVVIKKYKK